MIRHINVIRVNPNNKIDQIIIFILHEVGIFFFSISFYLFCLGFQVTFVKQNQYEHCHFEVNKLRDKIK